MTGDPRIVGFMPTPYTAGGDVDRERLETLTASIAAAGIEPAVLGGMGQYYALDRDESRACMQAAVAGAGGVPVIAAIGWSTREAVEIAHDAAAAGISQIVINPPHYAAPSPRAYAEHVRRVTDAAGVGAVVYSAGDYAMTDAHLSELIEVDGFDGVKEEHYSVAETADRIRRWGDRVQWWGVGEIEGSEFARVGADVVTTSLANLRPDLAVRAIRSLVSHEGDTEAESAARAWTDALAADAEGSPAFLTEVMHQSTGWERIVRLPLLASDERGQDAVRALVGRWAAAVVR